MKLFLLLSCLALINNIYSQDKQFKNAASLSVPLLFGGAEITNVYGASRQIKGSTFNYGVTASYERSVFKNIFLKVGIGYNCQKFNLNRPFDYTAPDGTKPLVTTKNYSYSSIATNFGIIYKYRLENNDRVLILGGIDYTLSNAIKEKYVPQTTNYPAFKSSKRYSFSNSLQINLGVEKKLNRTFSFDLMAIVPVLYHWKKDIVFNENPSDYFKPKYNLGLSIAVNYHF